MNDSLPDMFADYYRYSDAFPLLGIHCQNSGSLARLRDAFARLADGRLPRVRSEDLAICGLRRARTITFEVDTSLSDRPETPGSALDLCGDGIIHWRGTPRLWGLACTRVEQLIEHSSVSCFHFLPGDYADDSQVCIELGGPAWDAFCALMRPEA